MSSVTVGDLFNSISDHAARIGAGAPVWGGSRLVEDVSPKPVSTKHAAWLMRQFERARALLFRVRQRGSHGGKITRFMEAVYRALLFYCRDQRTGEVEPSYSYIADRMGASMSAVCSAVAALQTFGMVNWQRRCAPRDALGRLRQETNLYEFPPPDKWLYKPRPDAPAPHPATIGVPEPVLAPLEAAAEAAAAGDTRATIAHLETAASPFRRTLEGALARMGKSIEAAPPERLAAAEEQRQAEEARHRANMARLAVLTRTPKT